MTVPRSTLTRKTKKELEMTPGIRWWPRAVDLVERGDLATAQAEIGQHRTEVLLHALDAGRRRPAIPRPGEPDWEEYLSFMLRDVMAGPDPSGKRDEGTTVTMTEVYAGEGWRPGLDR